jgi:hypothetical protein
MENGDRSYKKGNTGHLVHFIGGGHGAVEKRNSGAGIAERQWHWLQCLMISC